jgi:hypothetical protein
MTHHTCPPCLGNCRQGRDCPAIVAPIGARYRAADPLPRRTWRDHLVNFAAAVLFAVLLVLVCLALLTAGAA